MWPRSAAPPAPLAGHGEAPTAVPRFARGLVSRAQTHSAGLAGDVLLTTLVVLLSGIPLLHDGASAAAWILSLLLVLPLLLRRAAPALALTQMLAPATAQLVLGLRLPADLALLLALFSIASRRPRGQAVRAAAVLEAIAIAAAFRIQPSSDGRLASLLFTTGLIAAAFFAGTTLQERRAYLTSVVDRAERLEREQAQQAQLAVTQERTRIAREMHDIVAHNLTVMITLAEAARAAQGEAADRAMTQVAVTGRDALAEMRRLLGVLRSDAAPMSFVPQPGLEQLEELVDGTRAAGLPAHLTTIGVPMTTSSTLQTSVYRVVQEALTNVLKHAQGPTRVAVTLTWKPEELLVSIQDDGQPERRTASGEVGHGILGMTERVGVFDGALSARPVAGGWRVEAHFRIEQRQP